VAIKGRFQPGQSGNPKGRPKEYSEIKALARTFGPEAIETLANLMRNSEDERTRVVAAKELLDRGFGKAEQSIDISGDVEVTKYVIRLPDAQTTSIEWSQQHKPAAVTQ
jgi:hypothetical protein